MRNIFKSIYNNIFKTKTIIVQLGSNEKEYGIPIIRLGQGRNIDIYIIDKKDDKNVF